MQRSSSTFNIDQPDNLIQIHGHDIHQEIVQHGLVQKLPVQDVSHLTQLNTRWCGFMTHHLDWKPLIARDFGISLETQARFIQLAQYYEPRMKLPFADIYRRLYTLKKNIQSSENKEDKIMNDYFRRSNQHFALLTCCLDDQVTENFLKRMIPRDESYRWIKISIFAFANYTAKQLLKLFPCNTNQNSELFQHSYTICNEQLTDHFITKSGRQLNARYFLEIGQSGSITFIIFCLGKINYEYGDVIACITWALLGAAIGGHERIVKKLIGLVEFKDINDVILNYLGLIQKPSLHEFIFNELKLTPKPNHVAYAAQVGSLEMVKFLVENRKLIPTLTSLKSAICSGNIEVVEYILNQGAFLFDKECLDFAAAACSLEYFQLVMQRSGLMPDHETMMSAAKSNSTAVMQYLTETVGLTPNLLVLKNAVEGGTQEMVEYLVKKHQLARGLLVGIQAEQLGWILCLSLGKSRLDKFNFLARERLPFISHDSDFSDLARRNIFSFQDKTHSTPIYHAMVTIRKAINHLIDNESDLAMQSFLNAATCSIRYFFEFAMNAVAKPDQYGLQHRHTPLIIDAMRDANDIEHTLIEREAIHHMLATASDEKLRAISSVFAPPQITPIIFATQLQR